MLFLQWPSQRGGRTAKREQWLDLLFNLLDISQGPPVLPWCTSDVLNELNCFCDPAFSKGPDSAAMYLEQVPTLQRARSKVTLEQRTLY